MIWVQSHVRLDHNEKADLLAKEATQRDAVDVPCSLSIAQLRAIIRGRQGDAANNIRHALQGVSPTLRSYVKIYNETPLAYGVNHSVLSDSHH